MREPAPRKAAEGDTAAEVFDANPDSRAPERPERQTHDSAQAHRQKGEKTDLGKNDADVGARTDGIHPPHQRSHEAETEGCAHSSDGPGARSCHPLQDRQETGHADDHGKGQGDRVKSESAQNSEYSGCQHVRRRPHGATLPPCTRTGAQRPSDRPSAYWLHGDDRCLLGARTPDGLHLSDRARRRKL